MAPRISPINERARGFCVPRALQPSPLAPCPPSPGPRSDGPTPGGYAARCPVPMLGVLGSSVNMGTRTPTVPPRHRPGTWLLKPIRDASLFREPTPLSAFATTREDVGYLLENRPPLSNPPRDPSLSWPVGWRCRAHASDGPARPSGASGVLPRRRAGSGSPPARSAATALRPCSRES